MNGDTLLTPGGGRWKLNLVDGQPVPIRLRGRDIKALPEIISDKNEIGYGFRIIRWHPEAGAAGDPERAPRPGSTP